jgi:hypothetical protein
MLRLIAFDVPVDFAQPEFITDDRLDDATGV